MAFSICALTLLLLSSCAVPASGGRERLQSEESESAGALAAGQLVLNDRFQLVESLWRKDIVSGQLEHAPLSSEVTEHYKDRRELYAGSFGEAWSAVDRKSGKKVVLKMFYTSDPQSPGGTKVLTWRMANQKPDLVQNLKDAAAECQIALNLQHKAASDRVGASRLMQCFEDHVTRGTSTTGHHVGEDDQLYQVLEDCGTEPLSKWILKNKALAASNPAEYVAKSLKLFKQMLEALRYLQDAKYVHHDLKPDNMVVKVLADGRELLKFIDFGAVTEVTGANARSPLVSTVPFAPPEWFPPAHGFDIAAPWSFDLYAVAVTFDEMMTGTMFYSKLLNQASRNGILTDNHINHCMQKMMRQGYPQQQAQSTCVQDLQMNAVKSGVNGAELSLTQHWGRDADFQYNNVDIDGHSQASQTQMVPWRSWATQEVPKLQHLLFDQGQFAAGYEGVTHEYDKLASSKHWFPLFMTMVAFDPTVRPTPATVLESRLLSDVDEVLEGSSGQVPTQHAQPALHRPEPPTQHAHHHHHHHHAERPTQHGQQAQALLGPAGAAGDQASGWEIVGEGKCLDAQGQPLGSTRSRTACANLEICKLVCDIDCAGIAWTPYNAAWSEHRCNEQGQATCLLYDGDAPGSTSPASGFTCMRPTQKHAPAKYDSREIVQHARRAPPEPNVNAPVPCPGQAQTRPGAELALCVTQPDGRLFQINKPAQNMYGRGPI